MIQITSRQAPVLVLFAAIAIFGISITSYAQGRGNGRGNGSNIDKKCAKFVNCHDARDGRWDGRGPAVNSGINPTVYPLPQQQPNTDIWRNRRNRDRTRDDTVLDPRSRNRRASRSNDDNVTQSGTSRRQRDRSDGTETRHRRVRRTDRNNVTD